jgi:hypothetical protein
MYYIRKVAHTPKGAIITAVHKKFADKLGMQKPKDYIQMELVDDDKLACTFDQYHRQLSIV